MSSLTPLKNRILLSWSIASHRHLIFAFFLLVVVAVISKCSYREIRPTDNDTIQADTIIPAGFVLHPIRLENIDAITGIIEKVGVIDLYSGQSLQEGAIKVAAQIRILRAPLNPNEFALLVPQFLSERIMKARGPFWGVIHNPGHSKKGGASEPLTPKPIRIEYHQGGL
jgi:hypothetical protein